MWGSPRFSVCTCGCSEGPALVSTCLEAVPKMNSVCCCMFSHYHSFINSCCFKNSRCEFFFCEKEEFVIFPSFTVSMGQCSVACHSMLQVDDGFISIYNITISKRRQRILTQIAHRFPWQFSKPQLVRFPSLENSTSNIVNSSPSHFQLPHALQTSLDVWTWCSM